MKITGIVLLVLSLLTPAWADNPHASADGAIIPRNAWVQLVFFDLWGTPEEIHKTVASIQGLPVTRIGVVPQLNVTQQHIAEYQISHPESAPLMLDTHFTLMRQYDIWELPVHVLLFNGEKRFAGDYPALQAFIKNLPGETQ